jgi:thiol-disulfide isomerase/thioredoxin
MACEIGNLTRTKDTSYQPVTEALSTLHQVNQTVEIVLFHGAWCPDSQREVPRFMRILELADNHRLHLTEYEVNRQKEDATGRFQEYAIQYVPTFIFISNGKELGRIVESPKKSLEEDFAAIVKYIN